MSAKYFDPVTLITGILTLALSFLPLASVQAQPIAAPAQNNISSSKVIGPSRDIAAIRAVGNQWRALYAQGRYAEIPELYTLDTMVMPRGRPKIEGREQMRRSIGGLASGRRVDIDVTEREITVFGNYGWFVSDFKVTYTMPNGAVAPATELGRSLVIFRRDSDRQWRIHRDMDSPAPHLTPATPAVPVSTTPAVPTPVLATSVRLRPVPAMWDPRARTEVTECDRMTASRYDRTRLAPPRAREAIDVPAAIAQCEADLLRFPNDPRLTFQLGRVYGYLGDRAKTLAAREASAAEGNHNTIFLLGYLDWVAAQDDATRCQAAREMKLAADRGNYSGQLTYASFFLEGKFSACPDAASASEVAAYVTSARPAVDGFFETRFADHLISQTKPAPASSARAQMMSQMQGDWSGTFRRYDAKGVLTETLPSQVQIRFPQDNSEIDYIQTNILQLASGQVQRLETTGKWDGDVLRFSSARVEGVYQRVPLDQSGLNSVLNMTFKDGSGMTVSEIITLSLDGKSRMRAAQYMIAGQIIRRTLIDETRP
jgi:ketosteroid isomerase-like protein